MMSTCESGTYGRSSTVQSNKYNGFQAEPSQHGLERFYISKELNKVNLRIEKGNNSKRKI
jgi:hypothetical protein